MAGDARLVDMSQDGTIAVLLLDAPPVNALSAPLRQQMAEAIRFAIDDPGIEAIVLLGAGRGFSGGADISEFAKPPVAPVLRDLLAIIDASPKPVVAGLHGTTLGGGFETALACHYRVAVPSTKMGLPEVKLGLIPGAGGTQRLPRLIGPKAALDAITSGTPFDARTALDLGLIDALTGEDDLHKTAVDFARRLATEKKPLRRIRDRNEKIEPFRDDHELFEAFRAAHARRFRGFDAPYKCIESIENAVHLPFDEGLAKERAIFQDLVSGAQSAAQRYAFFAERRAAKIPDVPATTTPLPIRKVGIIGAGTMGAGIAINFLSAGIPVTLVEIKAEALDRGIDTIRRTYNATALKGRMEPADVDARMNLLHGNLDLDALADCDLVIEAVFELLEVKQDIFRKLDRITKPGAILASNTSYLDIDALGSATSRADQVLGLHFFSPANLMRQLEVVRGAKTSAPVIATAMQLAKKIGKVAVVVGVGHGFVGNRILQARRIQADKLIVEGAMPWDVDRVLYDFGMPMGPFAMSDLAGLDLGWTRERSGPSTVRDILCERDRRGQKTSKGYYDYDADRRPSPSPEVERIILDFAAERHVTRRIVSDQEILERCLYAMINEGAKILEEGLALRASDIDVIWLNGYGFPAYRGGPMYHADEIGLDVICERLRAFEKNQGALMKPAALLERLAADGTRLRDV